MSTVATPARGPGFAHQAAIYGSDEEFLATAVPFLRDGLDAGEPVLAACTSANLELLRHALGTGARGLDYAESAYFGRRPPQRVAAFERYWSGRAPAAPGGRVRILAEPVWSGRTPAEFSEWKRMESGLNLLLAGTGIWMICPYDTRAVGADVAADARRTHPARIDGEHVTPCPEYTDPDQFARQRSLPWQEVPSGAALLPGTRKLRVLRDFADGQAKAAGLTGQRAAMLVMSVNEVASYLRSHGGGSVSALMWTEPGAVVCEVRAPGAAPRAADPFAGYSSPRLTRQRPGDGLWYARQFCDQVEIRPHGAGCRARLSIPAAPAVEAMQPALDG